MKLDYKSILISCLGGFQFSYNACVIAGALIFVKAAFGLSLLQEGFLASVFLFGAMTTACCAGLIANRFGRKPTQILGTVAFFFGCLLSAKAIGFEMLAVGRYLTGIGAGIMMTVIPLYLSEIAPVEKRGFVVHLNQVLMAIGALSAYLTNYFLGASGDWRLMFGLGCVAALVQAVGFFWIPESPAFREKQEMQEASWKDLFAPSYRPRLILGTCLCIFQQFTGINAVLYFAPQIFQMAGFSSIQGALFATIWIGVGNLAAILLSLKLIDRAGRRPLLLCSLWGIVLSLITLSLTFYTNSPYLGLLSITSLLLFTSSYTLGIGPIPPLVVAEISPGSLRGHALTFTGFMGWIVNYFVSLTFLSLNALLSPAGIFGLYALFALAGLLFIFAKVPETKQKSLPEIEAAFE